MTADCIDVSTWQRNIDWQRVRNAGMRAVIIRAGFSCTRDNQFENHYAGAKAAGLAVGAYWYSYAYSVEQAANEARACLEVIAGKTFELPVYYDMEEDGQMALGRSTMTAIACKFIDSVQEAGYRGGMYSSPSWFSDFIDYDLMRSRYSVWLAHWANRPARECDVWQYGENGRIDGIDGDVDVNVIFNESVIHGGSEPFTPDEKPDDPTPDAPAVKTVQSWLNGNYGSGLDVDGIYGRLTRAALVAALQTELNRQCGAGLVVDGIFGRATKAAVFNVAKGRRGNITRILQGILLCNGCGDGGFDGIFGAGTEAAVIAYQRKSGLYPDGIAGRETFAALCG